jgi:hypothetical protein
MASQMMRITERITVLGKETKSNEFAKLRMMITDHHLYQLSAQLWHPFVRF